MSSSAEHDAVPSETVQETGRPTRPASGMYSRAFMRAEAETSPPPRFEPVPPSPGPRPSAAAPQLRSNLVNRRPQRSAARRWLVPTGLGMAGLGMLIWLAAPDATPPADIIDAALSAPSAAGDPVPASVPARSDAREVVSVDDPDEASAEAVTPAAPPVIPPAAVPAARAVASAGRSAPAPADGSLVVESQPPGARVTINGIGWGVTPLEIGYLPLGDKRVRLIKDGYVSAERDLRLDRDSPSARLRVTLRPR